MSFLALGQDLTNRTGINCNESVAILKSITAPVFAKILQSKEFEVELAVTEIKNSLNLGLLKDMFGETLAEAGTAIDDVLGLSDAQNFGDVLENAFSSILGAKENIIDTVTILSAGLGVGLFDEQIRNYSLRRNKGPCEKSDLYDKLFGSSEKDEDEQAASKNSKDKAIALFTAMRNSVEGFGLGLFHIALTGLQTTINSEEFLIPLMEKSIKKINEEIGKLTDEDYSADHRSLVALGRHLLVQTDERLARMKESLSQGDPFNEVTYLQAQTNVDVAKQLFCDIDLEDAFGKLYSEPMLKIVGELTLLEAYVSAFENVARANLTKMGLVTKFPVTYSVSLAGVESFLTPLIDMIRCRVQSIVSDMEKSIDRNQVFTYLIQEKKWCVELQYLLFLFDGYKPFKKVKEAIEDNPFLQLDLSSRLVTIQAYVDNPTITFNQIVDQMNTYISMVKRKLSTNTPAAIVQFNGELALHLLDTYRDVRPCSAGERVTNGLRLTGIADSAVDNLDEFLDEDCPLTNLLNEIEEVAGPAIAIAQTYMTYLQDNNLDAAFESLSVGNIGDFFDLGIKGTIAGVVSDLVNNALDCCGSSANPETRKQMEQIDEIFTARTRSEALASKMVNFSDERHLYSLVDSEIPKYQLSLEGSNLC